MRHGYCRIFYKCVGIHGMHTLGHGEWLCWEDTSSGGGGGSISCVSLLLEGRLFL